MSTASPAPARPQLEVADLIHGVVDLVPLPQAYIRIREMVYDPEASLRDITEIVATDSALAARLLRLANSAYMGLAAKVEGIDQAVRVLGMNQIHDIALATSAVGSLSRLECDALDIHDFWRLSIYAAVCARQIALRLELPDAHRHFLSGLLHNVGTLVLAHRVPDRFSAVATNAVSLQRPYHVMQRSEFGFDYATVGAGLLRQWRLPDSLSDPIAVHTIPAAEFGDDVKLAASILQVAAATARATLWKGPADEPVPDYDPQAIALLDIDAAAIESIMNAADDEVIEAISLLLPS